MASTRYFFVLTLAAVLSAGSGAEGAEEQPGLAPIVISKAEQPMVIDGKLDEPAWREAQPVRCDFVWDQVGRRSEQPHLKAWFTWDDHYLYIGYETFDSNLVAVGNGKPEGPAKNRREGVEGWHPAKKVDVVEFFISFGDRRFFWELHQNAANHFSDIWITVTDEDWPISKTVLGRYGIVFNFDESLKDDERNNKRLATAVWLKPKADGSPSTVNDASDEDTGYTGELRVPWLGLGAPLAAERLEKREVNGKRVERHLAWKMSGQQLQILAVVQDGDLADRYHHSSPTFPGSWFHKGWKHWPQYVLQAERQP